MSRTSEVLPVGSACATSPGSPLAAPQPPPGAKCPALSLPSVVQPGSLCQEQEALAAFRGQTKPCTFSHQLPEQGLAVGKGGQQAGHADYPDAFSPRQPTEPQKGWLGVAQQARLCPVRKGQEGLWSPTLAQWILSGQKVMVRKLPRGGDMGVSMMAAFVWVMSLGKSI